MLIANLSRQGYREIKLHVILVELWGLFAKTIQIIHPLADHNMDYHKIK
jgi:hypothetical protein